MRVRGRRENVSSMKVDPTAYYKDPRGRAAAAAPVSPSGKSKKGAPTSCSTSSVTMPMLLHNSSDDGPAPADQVANVTVLGTEYHSFSTQKGALK